MRTVFGAALVVAGLVVGFAVFNSTAAAAPGDQVNNFLNDVQNARLPVRFVHLDGTTRVGASPPVPNAIDLAVTFGGGCCGDIARQTVAKVLHILAQAPVRTCPPDYCLYFVDEKRQTRVLWICSAESDLQMRYFSSDGVSDECQIIENPAGDVRDKLSGIFKSMAPNPPTAFAAPIAAHDGIVKMKRIIRLLHLPLDLLSLNPKQVTDAFGQKHWTPLGKVTIATTDEGGRQEVLAALNLATDPRARPRYTALAFTPRLAVSAKIPRLTYSTAQGQLALNSVPEAGRRLIDNLLPAPLINPLIRTVASISIVSDQYLLLMSFECRLAELYVGREFKGCCAITDGWKLDFTDGNLATEVGADQLLNNILADANQLLRPKTTSSSE